MSETMTIRNLRADEMTQIIGMAAREGWNPGLRDGAAFYRADSEGFFVGEAKGVPVAYISAVRYDHKYGFIGLYIVDEAYRGKGYGYQIWTHAVERLGSLPCGLDGVPAQVENYKKSGFVYAFRQIRLAATAIRAALDTYPLVERINTPQLDAVVRYDADVFGVPRPDFIREWTGMGNASAFCVSADGIIKGYAVIRKCLEGYKIGPLFADDAGVAEQLFLACHAAVEDRATVYIDMPETNDVTAVWIRRYGLTPVFETARMYKNGQPPSLDEKMFSVTSFELG